ncbi:MAG: hypothetical protein R2731_09730 [Nocardioides sp.]
MRQAVLAAVTAVAVLVTGCTSPTDGPSAPRSSGTAGASGSGEPTDGPTDAQSGDPADETPTKRIVTDLATIRVPRSYQVRSLVFTTAAFQRQLEATVTINVVTDMPDRGSTSAPTWAPTASSGSRGRAGWRTSSWAASRAPPARPADQRPAERRVRRLLERRDRLGQCRVQPVPAQRRLLNRIVLDSWTWR